jgi:uncharacterized protein (TIGR00730 family)
MNSQRLIAVFGSSAPQPNSWEYQLANDLGRRLAQANFAVVTGGYSGTMAAVSQGASEEGGYVIGVTSKQIERSRKARVNQWVDREINYETLTERVLHLVTNNQGMIVLPGGIGTLSEFALAWSLLQVRAIPLRPLILLGAMWQETLASFIQPAYVFPDHIALIRTVDSPADAVAILEKF